MHAGNKTLDWLRNQQLNVSDEWSVPTTDGFCWWADQHAQTIEVIGQEVGPDDKQIDLVFNQNRASA